MTPDEFLLETDWLGCGVADHPKDCLCDVRCDGPEVPIRMKNLVNDMKYADIIVDIKGYGKPWDRDDILDFLSDVVYAQDEIRSGRWSHVLSTPTTRLPELGNGITRAVRWKQLRNAVAQMLQVEPRPKVRQVLVTLGTTADEFTAAVTTNKCVLDAETLDRFEEVILTGTKPNITAISKQFGLSYEITRNLITYWGILPRIQRKGSHK